MLRAARQLTGPRWAEAKDAALGALQLPEDPQELLAGHAADLDQAWRVVGGGIVPDGPVSIDAEGRLHVAKDVGRGVQHLVPVQRLQPGGLTHVNLRVPGLARALASAVLIGSDAETVSPRGVR